MIKLRIFSFILAWLHCAACGILVPPPRIEPMPPVLEAWSLNHWTAREVPLSLKYNKMVGPLDSETLPNSEGLKMG